MTCCGALRSSAGSARGMAPADTEDRWLSSAVTHIRFKQGRRRSDFTAAAGLEQGADQVGHILLMKMVIFFHVL